MTAKAARRTKLHMARYRSGAEDLVRTWCGDAVAPANVEPLLGEADPARARCPRCPRAKAVYDAWGAAFKAALEALQEAEDPEARRNAWLATEEQLGPNPDGLPAPKRAVVVQPLRGRDGRGMLEVQAPRGARFAAVGQPPAMRSRGLGGTHAVIVDYREDAEQIREQVALERCPAGCQCGLGRPQ